MIEGGDDEGRRCGEAACRRRASQRRCAPTIRRRICCTRRCAIVSASMSARRAAWSRAERLRFDFSHPKALTPTEIAAGRGRGEPRISARMSPVGTRLMTPDDAIAAGAMALFGEKYGDEVRVLSMGAGCSDEHLFGRTVRRHACLGARRYRPVQDRLGKRGVGGRPPHRGADRRSGAAWLAGREDGCARRRRAQGRARGRAGARRRRWSRSGAGWNANWPRRRRRWRWAAAARPRPRRRSSRSAAHGFVAQVVDGLDPKGLRGLVDEAKKRIGSGVAVMRRGQRRPRRGGGRRDRRSGRRASARSIW